MKLPKSLIIAALVAGNLVAWDISARAQATNTPPPASQPGGPAVRGMRPPTLDQLTHQLALTEDQKPKVKAVLDEQTQKMAGLRTDASLTQEDRRTKMTAIRAEATAKMKEILTAEQFDKYQKMTPAGRPGGPGAPATPPPAAGKN